MWGLRVARKNRLGMRCPCSSIKRRIFEVRQGWTSRFHRRSKLSVPTKTKRRKRMRRKSALIRLASSFDQVSTIQLRITEAIALLSLSSLHLHFLPILSQIISRRTDRDQRVIQWPGSPRATRTGAIRPLPSLREVVSSIYRLETSTTTLYRLLCPEMALRLLLELFMDTDQLVLRRSHEGLLHHLDQLSVVLVLRLYSASWVDRIQAQVSCRLEQRDEVLMDKGKEDRARIVQSRVGVCNDSQREVQRVSTL